MLVDSWMKSNSSECHGQIESCFLKRKPLQILTDLHGGSIENSVKYLDVTIDEGLIFKLSRKSSFFAIILCFDQDNF